MSRHTVGLIERDNPSTRKRLWQLVADDSPVDDILDELSSTGLKALPDFGIAQVEGDAVRVVARGRVTVTAQLVSGDEHQIDPSGVRTWIEEVVADVVGLTISLSSLEDDPESSSSGEAFAVLAGSVPARSITRRFDVADAHADAAITGWNAAPNEAAAGAESQMDADAGSEIDTAHEVELEMVEPAADEAGDGGSWFDENADDVPATGVPPQPGESADAQPASPQPANPQPAGPPPVDPQPANPQPAGPPPVDPQPASPQPAGPPPVDPQPASPQPSGPPVSVGAAVDPIDTKADVARSGPPPDDRVAAVPPPEATVVVGPEDGPGRGPVSSIFDDDVVVAPGDTAAPAAAQVYGVLAFSNGERISVDRSVLIGRNPKVAGAIDGALPHIMKFDGPGQGLSRTHAEVRIENGEMLLEDLQSTNGTEIQLPGQQRRRLRSSEPVVVVPGTLIDFGDELHCTVETAG